ncbi:MAG: hypothetical protein HY862_06245 [Chloroflexi bacterium]|nr:hypothetical protein [Chloroflexota bacterium]
MTDQNQQEEVRQNQDTPEDPVKAFFHHQRLAFEEFGKAVESLLPPDFRDHTRRASQSFMESFKSLFDAAKADIDQMMQRQRDQKSAEGEEAPNETKVKVDIQ